jgi:hypothetical protein
MQQPPYGRPQPGQQPQPQRPPAYVPPQQQHPQYQQPVQQQPRVPLPPPAAARKPRGALKFLASTCVFSAWITLALSVLGAGLSFMGAATAAATLGAASHSQQYFPTTSSPSPLDRLNPGGGLLDPEGGSGGMSAPSGPFTGMTELFKTAIPAAAVAGGVFTLVTGVVSFLLFLGLGQAFYVLIDLEEQQHRMENMLQVLTLRPGGR